MAGRRSRRKGKGGERELARLSCDEGFPAWYSRPTISLNPFAVLAIGRHPAFLPSGPGSWPQVAHASLWTAVVREPPDT